LKAAKPLKRTKTATPPPKDEEDDGGGGGGGKKNQATELVELALGRMELWHTPGGHDADPFISIVVGGHKEHWPLGSRAVKRLLADAYFQIHERAPGANALTDALNVLAGRATHGQESAEHRTYVRVAGHGGRIYLDLCDSDWRAVEIGPDGWRVVSDPAVKFLRRHGMLALPEPVRGGSVRELRKYVNVRKEQWPLVVAWEAAALRPDGPFAVLGLHGEAGSAKTSTAEVLRRLVDPNEAGTRAEPREARDLSISARNGWVISLNNVSYLAPWLSDTLCRLNSGEGFVTRALYTDDGEVIFKAARPIILNGIEEICTRSDLADRALVLDLPTIREGEHRPENEFWAEFEAARPGILGALLDAVSAGLKRLPLIQTRPTTRLADFERWSQATEPALGLEVGAFAKAYQENRRQAVEVSLEASCVFGPLRHLLGKSEGGSWEGTATKLLEQLTHLATEDEKKAKGWPKMPHVLTGKLKRLAPALRKMGIDIIFNRASDTKRERTITLKPMPKPKEREDNTSH
jgi:hypothetical protein